MQGDGFRVDGAADQRLQRGKSRIVGGCVEAGIADLRIRGANR